LNFANCVFKDVSNNPIAFNNPIFLEVSNYDDPVARFGGLNFTDCVIFYDEDIPFFNQIGNPGTSDGLGNVNGNLFVINPNVDAGFETGPNPENVNITYEFFESFPATEVNFSASQLDYLEEEQFIQYEVSREDNLAMPIAVRYAYAGEATYGRDYNRESVFGIIPANSLSIIDTIDIILDDEEEPSESLQLTIVENDCIILDDESILNFTISEVITSVSENSVLRSVQIYPNPSSESLFIEVESTDFDLRIMDAMGRLHKSFRNLSFSTTLDINDLSSGIYFLSLVDNISEEVISLKVVKE